MDTAETPRVAHFTSAPVNNIVAAVKTKTPDSGNMFGKLNVSVFYMCCPLVVKHDVHYNNMDNIQQ